MVLLAQVVPGREPRAVGLIGVELDVVGLHLRRRVEARDAVRLDPTFIHDAAEHGTRFGEELARFGAYDGVFQDARIGTRELPRLEERRPVDVWHQLRQRVAA